MFIIFGFQVPRERFFGLANVLGGRFRRCRRRRRSRPVGVVRPVHWRARLRGRPPRRSGRGRIFGVRFSRSCVVVSREPSALLPGSALGAFAVDPLCRLHLLSRPQSNLRRGMAGPPSFSRAQHPALSQARACDAAFAANSPRRPSATARLPGTSGRRRLPSSSIRHGAPHRRPRQFLRPRCAATCYPEALG